MGKENRNKREQKSNNTCVWKQKRTLGRGKWSGDQSDGGGLREDSSVQGEPTESMDENPNMKLPSLHINF